jgi:hypothetical protein
LSSDGPKLEDTSCLTSNKSLPPMLSPTRMWVPKFSMNLIKKKLIFQEHQLRNFIANLVSTFWKPSNSSSSTILIIVLKCRKPRNFICNFIASPAHSHKTGL